MGLSAALCTGYTGRMPDGTQRWDHSPKVDRHPYTYVQLYIATVAVAVPSLLRRIIPTHHIIPFRTVLYRRTHHPIPFHNK